MNTEELIAYMLELYHKESKLAVFRYSETIKDAIHCLRRYKNHENYDQSLVIFYLFNDLLYSWDGKKKTISQPEDSTTTSDKITQVKRNN